MHYVRNDTSHHISFRIAILDLVNCVLAYPEELSIHALDVKNQIVLPEELTDSADYTGINLTAGKAIGG